MRILRLHVEAFGKLRDFDLELERGLNVLYRENGWGKSTLAAFVKAMLYGLPASTKRSLDENERKKYLPWQGGAYGGSLELECGKGRFRIERYFGAKESGDSFALYDMSTNLPSNAYSAEIGQELFGIDVGGFERTVYLSQHAVPGKGDNSSIAAKLGDLLDDVDDIGSFDSAMAALDKRRKYYVMTGERGRVADLQREIGEARTELERLARTEEALRKQEQAAAELQAQIRTAEAELLQVREQVRRAGLLHARAALLDQKKRMQAEVEDLDRLSREMDARLGGNHPTPSELEEKRGLLNRILEARARRNEIASAETASAHTELLAKDFGGTLPDAGTLDALLERNAELCRLSQREEALRAEPLPGELARFARLAPPSEQELQAARQAVEREERTRLAASEQTARRSGLFKTVAWCALALCLGVLVVALLPSVEGILAGALVGLSVLLAALSVGSFVASARAGRKGEQAASPSQDAARALLARYGMETVGDVRDRLTELSLLSRQCREQASRAEQKAKAYAALQTPKKELVSHIRADFAAYGITLPEKSDYQNEIDALRRDALHLSRAQAEEEQRRRRMEVAEREVRELQAELTPFLRRYDKEGRLKASECLRAVQEWETEYLRLCREAEQKREALLRFIREKQLNDATEDVAEAEGYAALEAKERALQGRLTELQEQKRERTLRIERLSQDADRIPELADRVTALEEEYETARANADTVARTMKYLEEAKTALSVRYLDDMQKSFSAFLEELIATEPPESVIDASFEVKLREGGKTQTLESFSQGWRDAVRFCTRLSLTDALYAEGEKPCLILDDPFVNLDDCRMEAAKRLLVSLSARYQVVYMVCHADRK